MLELNEIYCGDCLDVMQDIDNGSIDAIITDPPYGMSFMGKNWDKAVPSVKTWQECLRVLKQGAFAFVMCIPRQDCLAHMICNLSDAGFDTAFSSIYHTFASGFPKAQNISKKIDQRAGMEREIIGKSNTWVCPSMTKDSVVFLIHGKNWRTGNDITLSATPQAKALDGAYGGFQPKPAVEVIIVAMKPLEEKTYVDQALENGHGCTWLDDCRIPYENDEQVYEKGIERAKTPRADIRGGNYCNSQGHSILSKTGMSKKGRFPANVLCSDAVLDNGEITKSTGGTCIRSKASVFKGTEGRKHFNYGDEGSYSRYFSLDAWFAEHIKALPKEAQKTFPWLIVPKASKGEKNRGCGTVEGTIRFGSENKTGAMLPSKKIESHKIKGNYHPTCKPLKLMSWLITLASREGDIVLDPFCGSGTTAIAAKMLGRQYIGIEREEDYCEIARKRLGAIPTNLSSF